MIIQNLMGIMSEKTIRLSSLKKTRLDNSQDKNWKKINKLLIYISTNNIAELIEITYAGAKLVCEKTVFSKRTRTDPQNLDGKFDQKRG